MFVETLISWNLQIYFHVFQTAFGIPTMALKVQRRSTYRNKFLLHKKFDFRNAPKHKNLIFQETKRIGQARLYIKRRRTTK